VESAVIGMIFIDGRVVHSLVSSQIAGASFDFCQSLTSADDSCLLSLTMLGRNSDGLLSRPEDVYFAR
jgi:hypothetical protein